MFLLRFLGISVVMSKQPDFYRLNILNQELKKITTLQIVICYVKSLP